MKHKSIEVCELRDKINLIFDKMIDDGLDRIELNDDYYWHLWGDDCYDLASDFSTKNIGLGQLFDDWDELKKLGTDDYEPTTFHCYYVASIMNYIASRRGFKSDGN